MPPSGRSRRRPRHHSAPPTWQIRPLVLILACAVALQRAIEQELAYEPAEHGGWAAKCVAGARLSQLCGAQCASAAFGVLKHDEQGLDVAQSR